MKTLGIIGGLSPLSSIYFYSEYIKKFQKLNNAQYPQILINNVNMWSFIEIMADKEKAYEFLQTDINKIISQVDFLTIPCNTAHLSFDLLQETTPKKMISIIDTVVENVKKAKYRKIGLLGSAITTSKSPYFPAFQTHGIEVVTNSKADREKLDSIIFEEVVKGKMQNGHQELKRQIDLLKPKCEVIILACTELPLLVQTDLDYGIKLISSTDLLIDKCYKYAISEQ